MIFLKGLIPGHPGFTLSSLDGTRASRINLIFGREVEGAAAAVAPVFFTDHMLLSCSLVLEGGWRFGRGLWKLNCLLLEEEGIVERFSEEYIGWHGLQGMYQSRVEWWVETKNN